MKKFIFLIDVKYQMGSWGFFKKIKEAFKKAGKWVKDKVIKPVADFGKKVFQKAKPLVDTAVKLAPVIGAGVGAAYGNPAAGAKVGSVVQGVGGALGLGR